MRVQLHPQYAGVFYSNALGEISERRRDRLGATGGGVDEDFVGTCRAGPEAECARHERDRIARRAPDDHGRGGFRAGCDLRDDRLRHGSRGQGLGDPRL